MVFGCDLACAQCIARSDFLRWQTIPSQYQGDIFAAEYGSWNRSVRVGYELIRVPFDQYPDTRHATGEYEDFMTGFVVDNGLV
jgi:glucose/arabinose dehydrogenase